jgi:hypothetical protein
MVRIQRRFRIVSKLEGCPGLHRYKHCGERWWIDLDDSGLFVVFSIIPSDLRQYCRIGVWTINGLLSVFVQEPLPGLWQSRLEPDLSVPVSAVVT